MLYFFFFFGKNIEVQKCGWKICHLSLTADRYVLLFIAHNSRRFWGCVLFIVDAKISPSCKSWKMQRRTFKYRSSSRDNAGWFPSRRDFFKPFVTELRLFFVYSFSLLQTQLYIFYEHTRYILSRRERSNNAFHEEFRPFSPSGNACEKMRRGSRFLAQMKETAGTVKFFLVYRFCSRSKHSVFLRAKYSAGLKI